MEYFLPGTLVWLMTVRNQTIKIYRGDTASRFIALTHADGTPYDPSINVTFKWQVARNAHTPDDRVLIRKEIGNGITTGVGGVTIELNAANTNLVPGLYYHELKVFDAEDVSTAMTGVFIIRQSLGMAVDFQLAPADRQLALMGELPNVSV